MRFDLLMLMVLLSLSGCNTYPPPDELNSGYTTCQTDDECVVVELGCCTACNGGTAVAVRTDQADEVADIYSERCGNGVDCTQRACDPLEAVCQVDTCILLE
ncbi:MAG: hypothetical protein AAFV53_21510 [Myxococcota bacterium]